MGTRGYDLVGTGYFGPKTKAAVLDLQAKAGLNVVGYIGPKTWAAAWGSAGAASAPQSVGIVGLDLHTGDERVLRGGPGDRAGLAGQDSSSRVTPTGTCSASRSNWAAAATG